MSSTQKKSLLANIMELLDNPKKKRVTQRCTPRYHLLGSIHGSMTSHLNSVYQRRCLNWSEARTGVAYSRLANSPPKMRHAPCPSSLSHRPGYACRLAQLPVVPASIIRNIRFFDAVTCLPGATVPIILEKIQDLLLSLSATITRIIVHVGRNYASRHLIWSELTKVNFISLIDFLGQCGKACFISGPIPMFCRGGLVFQ